MIVEHQPDAILLDLDALRLLLGRTAETIRRHCGPGPYDAHQAAELLAGVPDVIPVTAGDAQRYLGVPAGTVWSWASRGQIVAVGWHCGRPTYDHVQVLELANRRPDGEHAEADLPAA